MRTAASVRHALELVLAVFVTLKLTGVITLSWWWVMAPMWVPALIAVSMYVLAVIFLREVSR